MPKQPIKKLIDQIIKEDFERYIAHGLTITQISWMFKVFPDTITDYCKLNYGMPLTELRERINGERRDTWTKTIHKKMYKDEDTQVLLAVGRSENWLKDQKRQVEVSGSVQHTLKVDKTLERIVSELNDGEPKQIQSIDQDRLCQPQQEMFIEESSSDVIDLDPIEEG
jgi:hypothetical protein